MREGLRDTMRGGMTVGMAEVLMQRGLATGAAAVMLAAMVSPRAALAGGGSAAGAASTTPVRAAGAFGAGDQESLRADVPGAGESAAVEALRERVGRQGYLLREVRWDPVLRQSWAVLEAVGHPERPYVSVLVPLAASDVTARRARGLSGVSAGQVSAGQALAGQAPVVQYGASASGSAGYGRANSVVAGPVVHVGDQVTLWSEERNLHVQLTAVADQNGAVGETIRLHMLGVSMGWEQTPQRLTGTVRGAGSVEMTQ